MQGSMMNAMPAVVMATGSYDHTVRFWDPIDHQQLGLLQHNESQINCMAMDRDRTLLAVGGFRSLRIFHAKHCISETIAMTMMLNGNNHAAADGVADANNSALPISSPASVGHQEPLHVYDTGRGNTLVVGFSSDNTRVWALNSDGTLRWWSVLPEDATSLAEQEINACLGESALSEIAAAADLVGVNVLTDAALSKDGRVLAVTDEAGRVGLWDLEHKVILDSCRVTETAYAYGMNCSASAIRAIPLSTWTGVEQTVSSPSMISQTESGVSHRRQSSHDSAATSASTFSLRAGRSVHVFGVSLSPTLHFLAACDRLGRVHVWDIGCLKSEEGNGDLFADGNVSTVVAHPGHRAIQCLFGPMRPIQSSLMTSDQTASNDAGSIESNGQLQDVLLTLGSDHVARLWSVECTDGAPSLSLLQQFKGHLKWVWDAVFSADGAYIVTASSDGTARLWDTNTGEEIGIYSGHEKAVVSVVLNDLALPHPS